MKRILLLTVAIICLGGCMDGPQGEKAVTTNRGYTVKTIDGCEYIEVSYLLGGQSGFYSLTHKGNCKNPAHSCSTMTEVKP